MENAPPVVSASALQSQQQQAHAWETVKENFKPLKKGRKPEELAPEVAPLGLACAAPPGAEEERRCVSTSAVVAVALDNSLAYCASRAKRNAFSQRRAGRGRRQRHAKNVTGEKKNCQISLTNSFYSTHKK